jgi:hypothetical protein
VGDALQGADEVCAFKVLWFSLLDMSSFLRDDRDVTYL